MMGVIAAVVVGAVGSAVVGGVKLKILDGQKSDIESNFLRSSAPIMERARQEAFLLGRQADRGISLIRQQAGAAGFAGSSFAPIEDEVTKLTIENQSRIIAGAKVQVDALRRRARNQKKAVKRQQLLTVAGIFAGQSQQASSLIQE